VICPGGTDAAADGPDHDPASVPGDSCWLAIGDLSVRASLASACALLPATGQPVSARRALCLLASLIPPVFTLPAAASALQTSEATAERVLDMLIDVHVLVESAPGRYRVPELIQLYAANLASEPPRAGRQ
jgi:hypothetical protein